MTNIEFLELVNQIRVEHGESKIRLNDLNVRIIDELEDEYYETFVVENPNKTTSLGIVLNLEQCILIGMRETKGVRRSVIQYIKNLQVKNAQPVIDLNNPEFLRQALLGYTEKVIELEQKVHVLEPKAKGLDRIADCTNVLGIREAAKVLKIGQNQLTQYLLDHKVVYRDQHSKIQAYQKSIDQKLVHVVTSAPRMFESGEKVFTQVKLTQKLIARIAMWLEKGVAA